MKVAENVNNDVNLCLNRKPECFVINGHDHVTQEMSWFLNSEGSKTMYSLCWIHLWSEGKIAQYIHLHY